MVIIPSPDIPYQVANGNFNWGIHLTLASGGTRVLLKMAELPSVSEKNIELL